MCMFKKVFFSGACLLALGLQSAQAHFPWLTIQNRDTDQPVLQVYFAEVPEADDAELLKYVTKAKLWQIAGRGEAKEVELTKTETDLHKDLDARSQEAIFVLSHDLGVMNRGDAAFRINYYAKTGPALSSRAWQSKKTAELLGLDVLPTIEDGQLELTVLYQGQPAAGAEVTLVSELVDLDEKLTTDDKGQARYDLSQKPIHAVRVKFVEKSAGEVEGKAYDEVRHYTTATFPAASYHKINTTVPYPEIPETVTSFGAAVDNGTLYIYGGHSGGAHSYSNEEQGRTVWSLELKEGSQWKSLGQGPRLQGLALVADEGKLYRIGGFTAKNKEGEDHDLWSQDSFARFDPKTGEWTDLTPLPEPRSSFDAAVLDHKIYVIGGWSMQGGQDSQWHNTAYVFDLKAEDRQWTKLPEPPFERRALSVAAFEGKIYAIGGMQSSGGPTTRVAIFDPKSGEWSEGPQLIGSGMTGFGTSAFAVNGKLYVSTYDGTLQTLSDNGAAWEMQGNLENARFFHRMVPADEKSLIFIGGASMTVGKFSEVEVLNVAQ